MLEMSEIHEKSARFSNDCTGNEMGHCRKQTDDATNEKLAIFYDGECPICRKEIEFYQRIGSNENLLWHDVNLLTDNQLPFGKKREQLLRIFHARNSSGEWQTGVDAFGALWLRLPIFSRLAWLFSLPGSRHFALVFYWFFLAWQRMDRARRQRAYANKTSYLSTLD